MFAYAMSSILTGLAFGTLGALRLGRLSEFFPRHILVGTIGGVGAFLFVTGLQVSARLEEGSGFSLELVRHFFDLEILPLWVRSPSPLSPHVVLHVGDARCADSTSCLRAPQTIPLVLALGLRLITAKFSHPLIFPAYFLAIPPVFYIVALSARVPVGRLRELGWVFEVDGVDNEWYEYITHFSAFPFSSSPQYDVGELY